MEDFVKRLLKREKRIYFQLPKEINKNILVIAPHPDDETLGCGGIIHQLLLQGSTVSVIVMTRDNTTDERYKELEAATIILGKPNVYKLSYLDGRLDEYVEQASVDILDIIENTDPSIIFIPYIFDSHPDHITISKILIRCLNMEESRRIAMYEVWTPILFPNYYIDITENYNAKYNAILQYLSQDKRYGIVKKTESINHMRAKLLNKSKVKYVEAFKIFYEQEYLSCINWMIVNQII